MNTYNNLEHNDIFNYDKINYNNFLKILRYVFNDIEIFHDENISFIYYFYKYIYGKSFLYKILNNKINPKNYDNIIILCYIKFIIAYNNFLFIKKDNNTLIDTETNNFIITSKSNKIDILYNYLKYLYNEYHRIYKKIYDNINNIHNNNYDNDNDLKNIINDVFYNYHLFLCYEFISCNLSSIRITDNNIDTDLIIQRNLKYLYSSIFDKKKTPNETDEQKKSREAYKEYKEEFIKYHYNYCKKNNLLDENGEIKYITVEDFLINNYGKIVYFDKKINDYYNGCYIQLNGIENIDETLDKYLEIVKKKRIEKFQLIV